MYSAGFLYCFQKRKSSFLRKDIKYLPVILERNDGKRTIFQGAERLCKNE